MEEHFDIWFDEYIKDATKYHPENLFYSSPAELIRDAFEAGWKYRAELEK